MTEKHPVNALRSTERSLLIMSLIIVFAVFGFSFLIHMKADGRGGKDWHFMLVYAGVCVLAHIILCVTRSLTNQTILPVLMLLNGIGLSYQYRLSAGEIFRWEAFGIYPSLAAPLTVTAIAVALSPERLTHLARLSWLWHFFSLAIPGVVVMTGIEYRGAKYGPGLTTPTEIFKLFFLLSLCSYLASNAKIIAVGNSLWSIGSLKVHSKLLIIWLLPQLMFVFQGDLGMAAISSVLMLVILFMATGRKMYPAIAAVFVVGSAAAVKFLLHKGQVRFQAWLSPFDYPDTSGYQIIQSLFAIFHGAMFGQGVGGGQPDKIPLVNTDFVYASMCEEFGFLSSILMLGLFFHIVFRAFEAGFNAKNPFVALVCAGSGAILTIQILFNIGGVIKLTPMTGVPLPFISHGGMAALTFSGIIGLILSATAARRKSPNCQQKTKYAKTKSGMSN